MVAAGPAADVKAATFELGQRRRVDTWFRVDDLFAGMEAWTVDRALRIKPLVEDAGDDRQQRSS